MFLPRTQAWWQRINFPIVATAALGFGSEYWDLHATNYESYAALKARLIALNRRPTDRYIATELSQFLLDDALVAAGGVERAYDTFTASVAQINAYIAQNGITYSPNHRTNVAAPATQDAWYGFADLISWSRAFEERLDRPPRSGRLRRQGLVPSLRPKRLRNRADAALMTLRTGPVGETRNLTNFSLHAALLRNPMSGVRVTQDSTAKMPLPDPVTGPVHHWYVLTWHQDRDAVAFAQHLWQSVAQCMEDIIAAFERSVPRRLRP
jgi:hypothetical protein